MTVIVKHNKTNTITDWTQAYLNEQIALGNYPPGTLLADIVLPSDWNNDHTLTGLGTMAEQDATAVAITGGTINNTTIGATTATTGRFTTLTTSGTATIADTSTVGQFGVKLAPNFAAGSSWDSKVSLFGNVNLATGAGSGAFGVAFDTTQGTSLMSIAPAVAWYNTRYLANNHQFLGLGFEQFRVSPTSSAVNYVQVTGGATTAAPVISSQGSDGNIALSFVSKGTARHNFFNNGATSSRQFAVGTSGITGAVNFLNVDGSVAGIALPMQAQGTDTNISMAFQPKGTGAIDLAAGSSGVNISNGGTVTAITRTTGGSAYTGVITATISAPTTAGGVQATVAIGTGAITQAIAGGGTGYTVGNILTVSGGTFINSAQQQIRVDTVSSGVITGISVSSFGQYTTLPTNPVSVTGGSGSGATFNLSNFSFVGSSITNAGSGYIEQPTITFSGGGGSGAAATARVGSGTTFKSLGGTSSFSTYSGEGLRINNDGFGTLTDYIEIQGGASVAGAYIGVNGSTATASLYASAKGGGTVDFFTNGQGNARQARVAHTASAVNYVQVTGSATGNPPIISAQGSDGNIALRLYSKGTNAISFWTNNGGVRQFQINHTAGTVVNYAQATGNIAGASPSFGVDGTDTNIDLALTPKGTGLVRFGTYVAGALLATGYINIKAADGTTYKVLVST
jgi:hypothetical protein